MRSYLPALALALLAHLPALPEARAQKINLRDLEDKYRSIKDRQSIFRSDSKIKECHAAAGVVGNDAADLERRLTEMESLCNSILHSDIKSKITACFTNLKDQVKAVRTAAEAIWNAETVKAYKDTDYARMDQDRQNIALAESCTKAVESFNTAYPKLGYELLAYAASLKDGQENARKEVLASYERVLAAQDGFKRARNELADAQAKRAGLIRREERLKEDWETWFTKYSELLEKGTELERQRPDDWRKFEDWNRLRNDYDNQLTDAGKRLKEFESQQTTNAEELEAISKQTRELHARRNSSRSELIRCEEECKSKKAQNVPAREKWAGFQELFKM